MQTVVQAIGTIFYARYREVGVSALRGCFRGPSRPSLGEGLDDFAGGIVNHIGLDQQVAATHRHNSDQFGSLPVILGGNDLVAVGVGVVVVEVHWGISFISLMILIYHRSGHLSIVQIA